MSRSHSSATHPVRLQRRLMSLLLTFLAAILTVGGLTLTAAPANADTLEAPVFGDTPATLVVRAGQPLEIHDFVPVSPTDLSNITVDVMYGEWFTTLNIAKDGTISGYVPYGKDFSATLWARNDTTGQYTTRDIHIIAQDPAQIFVPQLAPLTVGQASAAQYIYTNGFPLPTLTAESLPAGMTLSAGTDQQWILSGTPASGTVGVHHVTLRATQDGMPDVTQTVDVTVNPANFTTGPNPTLTNVDTPKVGDTLNLSFDNVSTIDPAPMSLSYQWFRNGAAITGATAPSYHVTADDLGARLKLAVTAHKFEYNDATGTYTTAAVLPGDQAEPTAPQINGTLTVGHTLSVDPGTATPEADSVTYQWFRSGTLLPDGTDGSYELTASDVGEQMSVTVTRHRAGYYDKATSASADGTVAPGTLDATPAPTVTGTAQVDHPMTAALDAATSTYLADHGLAATLHYQWLRDGDPIADATDAMFTAAPADAGHDLSARVTVNVDGYDPVTGTSAVATIANGTFTSVPVPTVTGTAKVGRQLSAHLDNTTPAAQHTSYQWLRDGDQITGATSDTYTATHDDLGHRLTVKSTVTSDGYDPASTTSAPTGRVAPNAAPRLTVTLGQRQLVLGHRTTMTWSSTDADTVSLGTTSPAPVAASGTLTLKPTKTGRYTYKATATNSAGTTTATVTLKVVLPAAELRVTTDRTLVSRRGLAKVTASGLARGEKYTITLAGTRITSGTASTNGRLNRLVRIPATAPSGTGALVVTGAQANRTGSTKLHVLTAKHLTLTPASRTVRASHLTSVTVSGLAGGESVVVKYRGVRVSAAHAHANSRGRYAVRFNVRRDWGWRTLTAHGAISTRSATTKIAIYPYHS